MFKKPTSLKKNIINIEKEPEFVPILSPRLKDPQQNQQEGPQQKN